MLGGSVPDCICPALALVVGLLKGFNVSLGQVRGKSHFTGLLGED